MPLKRGLKRLHGDEDSLGPWKLNRTHCAEARATEWVMTLVALGHFRRKDSSWLLRKEVIQPQVPLRLPCYDFTPVTVHSLGPCLSPSFLGELAQALLEQTTPMV